MPKTNHGRIVIIHGVRFKQIDRDNLRKIATSFRAVGFTVVLPTYGYLPALIVGLFQWLDNRIADSMSAFIQDGDILLGHSNGGALVYLISKKVHIRGAVLVNAALEESLVPDASFVHVYYNKGDWVSKLSALIPFHIWGNMGDKGYTGNDPRVVNIDQGNPPLDCLPRLNGHSDIFTSGKLRPWARYMAERCLQAIQPAKTWSVNHD